MKEIILNALNNHMNITQIEEISSLKMYDNEEYQYIFRFIYTVTKTNITMVIGVPVDWDRKLIDIYIENYRGFKYIPHVESNGKMCLFDLEGVLIDKNFEGLLNQTLRRLNKTLVDGINELNKIDFIEEFEEYWGRLPNIKILKSMISTIKGIKLIKYADDQKTVKIEKKEKYIDILRKKNLYSLVSSDSERDFALYKDMNTIKNGVYIYIESNEYIYPPDWRDNLNIEYVNNLLNHKSIDKDKLSFNIAKCKGDLVVIFNVRQPNDCTNIMGILIKNYIFDKVSSHIKIQSQEDIIPCWVMRCDKEFLINRGGANSDIYKKRILVIGCGSIGGYLINELVKTGINSIDVLDRDMLKEENIYRHLLGMEYVNEYKSKAIVDYINKNIPDVNIRNWEDNIEDAISDESISLEDYDLIVSAVGNHNVNRWINDYVLINKIKIPVVYLWNEVLGIGNHVAFIASDNKGCYECFFDKNEEEIYDKTSYCERGQSFTKRVRGCGTSYLPFSSTNSITTVITGIEVIKNYFEGRLEENFLISIKGDDYYLQKAGFKASHRYNVQLEVRNKIEGEKFKNEYCFSCGDK